MIVSTEDHWIRTLNFAILFEADVSNRLALVSLCLGRLEWRSFAVAKPQNNMEAGRFHSPCRRARFLRRQDPVVMRNRPLRSSFISLDGGMLWLLGSRVPWTQRWRLGLRPDAVNHMFNCLRDDDNFNCLVLICAADELLPARGTNRTRQIPRESAGGGRRIDFVSMRGRTPPTMSHRPRR